MMKRYLCLVLALLMILLSFSLTACKDTDKNDDKETEASIPEGYKLYENEVLSFAYPEDWTLQDGSTVMLVNPTGTGNNITVVYEAKTDMYETMSLSDFNKQLKPMFEAMGVRVSGTTVDQVTNPNDLDITKITMSSTVSNVTMKQNLFIITVGERTYTITVTEATSDANLPKNVFNTLDLVK